MYNFLKSLHNNYNDNGKWNWNSINNCHILGRILTLSSNLIPSIVLFTAKLHRLFSIRSSNRMKAKRQQKFTRKERIAGVTENLRPSVAIFLEGEVPPLARMCLFFVFVVRKSWVGWLIIYSREMSRFDDVLPIIHTGLNYYRVSLLYILRLLESLRLLTNFQ